MKKNLEKRAEETWREMEKRRNEVDKLDREHYERRIDSLLDLRGIGKGTRDYEPALVKIAAKAWMYLDRNKDCLKLTNMYKARAWNPGDEEVAIVDSTHVQSVKKHRIVLEGCLIAMGLPSRIAYEANI